MEERELFERRPRSKPRGTYYWIYRPRPGDTITGILLNHYLEEHLTHWLRGRSVPHMPAWQGCEGCNLGWQPYSRWYSGIIIKPTGKVGLIELTEGAMESCPRLLDDDFAARGQAVRVKRALGKSNGRVSVVLDGMVQYADKLPPPVDVGATMMRILEVFRGKQGGN